MSVTQLFSDFIVEDLAKSGLEISDMNVRPLTSTERHATGSPQQPEGYVIPYRGIGGQALPFYRVRLKGWDPKYKQLTDEPNHLYFPRGFWDLANDDDTRYILFVEGEKKAACAVKHGFACVACGGVDSWSNKTVALPGDAKLTKGRDGRIIAKLPSGSEDGTGTHQDELAAGMKDLIDLVIKRGIPLVIVYDSDEFGMVPPQVQAAAARLGYALRFHGVPAKHIRQFVIKPPPGFVGDKLGLDDLLVGTSIKKGQLDIAIQKVLLRPSAFPKHPNPREYINKKLRRSKMSREQLQALATSILCDLDASGTRLYSPDEEELYYFSRESHRLMKVSFKLNENFAKSDWGVYLYRTYNLSAADERVLIWLESLFAGEEPIREVQPERVLAIRDDAIYYQINGAQMIRVNAREIRVLDNGSDDILFLSDAVQDLDKAGVVEHINKLLQQAGPLENYWFKVLCETRIADDEERSQARLLSYLYSISPWFYRWRGTQLPVEMVIGEPGSGKSTIYELRLGILNGDPKLRNPPKDIDNWGVSVGNTGGIHVTDNVNLINSGLRQQISDEMCRCVTASRPTIEKRKLYADNTLIQIPVKTVFAVTSVRQPFNAPDIIQRSVITFMDKGAEAVEYSGDWAQDQLERFGGREGWIAYHLVFIHRLLQKVQEKWVDGYKAKFRLKNAEQLFKLSAELYGEEAPDWVIGYVEASQADKIADNDNVLGALRKFAEYIIGTYGENNKGKRFTAKEIAEQMAENEEFNGVEMLTNARKLGKFMKNNPNLLATVAGITEWGTSSNATSYIAHKPKT